MEPLDFLIVNGLNRAPELADVLFAAGIIGGVFVFCLPGSNGAVKDGWDKVISAQLDSRHGPCNMVELMPRLLEE